MQPESGELSLTPSVFIWASGKARQSAEGVAMRPLIILAAIALAVAACAGGHRPRASGSEAPSPPPAGGLQSEEVEGGWTAERLRRAQPKVNYGEPPEQAQAEPPPPKPGGTGGGGMPPRPPEEDIVPDRSNHLYLPDER